MWHNFNSVSRTSLAGSRGCLFPVFSWYKWHIQLQISSSSISEENQESEQAFCLELFDLCSLASSEGRLPARDTQQQQ